MIFHFFSATYQSRPFPYCVHYSRQNSWLNGESMVNHENEISLNSSRWVLATSSRTTNPMKYRWRGRKWRVFGVNGTKLLGTFAGTSEPSWNKKHPVCRNWHRFFGASWSRSRWIPLCAELTGSIHPFFISAVRLEALLRRTNSAGGMRRNIIKLAPISRAREVFSMKALSRSRRNKEASSIRSKICPDLFSLQRTQPLSLPPPLSADPIKQIDSSDRIADTLKKTLPVEEREDRCTSRERARRRSYVRELIRAEDIRVT